MTRTALVLGLAAAMAVPMIASPTSALASCHDRKVGGTVLGAVAGGFAGNALAHGGGRAGGTVLGALAGGVIGHEIAGSGCHTHAYYRTRTHSRGYATNDYYRDNRYAPARCHYEDRSYYDARGRLVTSPTQVCD